MKKALIALLILFAAFTNASAQDTTHHQHHAKTRKMKTSKAMYTCPMDTDVVQSKPGKCPKCGMDLVKMKPKK